MGSCFHKKSFCGRRKILSLLSFFFTILPSCLLCRYYITFRFPYKDPSGRELSAMLTEGVSGHKKRGFFRRNIPQYRSLTRSPSVTAAPCHLPPGGRLIWFSVRFLYRCRGWHPRRYVFLALQKVAKKIRRFRPPDSAYFPEKVLPEKYMEFHDFPPNRRHRNLFRQSG